MNTIKTGWEWLLERLGGRFGARFGRREVIRRRMEIQLEFPWLSKR
jgi:hypothetical protein